MLPPAMNPRIEERRHLARFPVHRRHVWPLVPVAVKARESQVRQLRLPAMLLRDDVIGLVRPQRCAVWHAAIFAAAARAPRYLCPA